MAAEEFAQDALAAVADHRPADGARSGDPQPGRPNIVALVCPEQKPASVETPAAFAGDIEIDAAPDALRRLETETALRGVRQR